MPLNSLRFSGDAILEACLSGQHRMQTPEQGDAVRKVQQALIDLGYPIPDGATGSFFAQTGAAVVAFKKAHRLSPADAVVGPGTIEALDIDVQALDAGNYVPGTSVLVPMQGKFFYFGEGAKIPGSDFGLAFSRFDFLLSYLGSVRGYTTASSVGLTGVAALETPMTTFLAQTSPLLANLHGAEVRVAMSTSSFAVSGGTVDFTMTVNSGADEPAVLSFVSNEVRGVALVAGSIEFNATLLELPADQANPDGHFL